MDKNDVISDVFSALRIRSNLYFRAHLGGGNGVRVPEERRRIRFHLVLRGQCWIEVAGEAPVLLGQGDIGLVPNGASQILSIEAGAPAAPLEQFIRDGALVEGVLRTGDGAVETILLCGFCRFDESVAHPAVAGLPPLMHLSPADFGAEPWLAATMKLLELEAGLDGQGATAILGRLIEIVIIQATRRIVSNAGADGKGFIAALADPALSRALQAMHRAPERVWRVGDLAETAGMSRARFAQRFAKVVGVPPMDYLTGWRLLRARTLLAESGLGIEDIAERCGYASLPSFSRRFKIRFGMGPGAFRRSSKMGED